VKGNPTSESSTYALNRYGNKNSISSNNRHFSKISANMDTHPGSEEDILSSKEAKGDSIVVQQSYVVKYNASEEV
jgi:hypothetical protein